MSSLKHGSDGKRGSGKSLTIAHVLHFCFQEKWLLVHVPWGTCTLLSFYQTYYFLKVDYAMSFQRWILLQVYKRETCKWC